MEAALAVTVHKQGSCPRPRPAPSAASLLSCYDMTEDFTTESIKQIFGLIVTAVAGYMFAAFKKASKTELETLEKRVDEKLRERQALVIEPLKAQLATLEARLSDCITTRELDAKFSALEKRLDDILAMMQAKH